MNSSLRLIKRSTLSSKILRRTLSFIARFGGVCCVGFRTPFSIGCKMHRSPSWAFCIKHVILVYPSDGGNNAPPSNSA
jgi:hypothetical protein